EAAPAATPAREAPLRASAELAVGRIDQRLPAQTVDANRESFDLRYATRLNEAWRIGFSDRIDNSYPPLPGQSKTLNSLREAWIGWQAPGQPDSVDFGRINFRQGPAYGYNPTDYFRTGGLRTLTTADPVTLREMRMGTVMLRLGRMWTGGGVTLALAPKLENGPSTRGGSPDFGATNANDRALLTLSERLNDRVSGQGLLLLERGRSPTLGVNGTALVGESLVAHAEWSSSRQQSLQDRILAIPGDGQRTQQAAAGLTFTFPNSFALTAEAEYNGAGLDRNGWNTVMAQGPAAYQAYQALIQPSQELGSRRAWLLYGTMKGLGLKQLDLTAFVRSNAVDHSRLAWAELRYHWPRWDVALQWQGASGATGTEYGSLPYRQVVQLLGVFYF
ncbi:MAG: hypothetical protein KGI35_13500, partial [Burkholderiales bacterium]|nr:hypothetical protein [Burkholderiales bacterium]